MNVCEVCQAPGEHTVRDVQHLEPGSNSRGQKFARYEVHSVHHFCDAHRRNGIEYDQEGKPMEFGEAVTVTKKADSGVTFKELREALSLDLLRQANAERQKEWDKDNGISIEYRGNELAGETGEACNIIKKLARERMGIRGSRATVADLAAELADVVICVDLIAMCVGIDLGMAVREKFNATSKKYNLNTRLGE